MVISGIGCRILGFECVDVVLVEEECENDLYLDLVWYVVKVFGDWYFKSFNVWYWYKLVLLEFYGGE